MLSSLQDFLSHRRSLVEQGRMFCAVTAPECRHKIADLAIGFLRDDCVVGVSGIALRESP